MAASLLAQLTLTDVELTQNRETGLFLDRAGTRATLTRTVVSGTLPRASNGRFGWGIAAQGGRRRGPHPGGRTTGDGPAAPRPSRATLVDALVRRTSLGLDTAGESVGWR